MRAQKFGTPLSDDAKKAARAERFGTPGGTKGSSSIGPTVVSKSLSLSPSLRSSYNVQIPGPSEIITTKNSESQCHFCCNNYFSSCKELSIKTEAFHFDRTICYLKSQISSQSS